MKVCIHHIWTYHIKVRHIGIFQEPQYVNERFAYSSFYANINGAGEVKKEADKRFGEHSWILEKIEHKCSFAKVRFDKGNVSKILYKWECPNVEVTLCGLIIDKDM